MSDHQSHSPQIAWVDLTIGNAVDVRDFYVQLVGFRPEPVDMGGYDDYNMVDPSSDQPVLGICHKKGVNASLPPQWIVYFVVPDLEAAIAKTVELGGEVIDGPRSDFVIIRDPGGAVTGLLEASRR